MSDDADVLCVVTVTVRRSRRNPVGGLEASSSSEMRPSEWSRDATSSIELHAYALKELAGFVCAQLAVQRWDKPVAVSGELFARQAEAIRNGGG